MQIRSKLAGLLSLPKEIALNLPLVIVTGRDELNIENYKSIVEYADQQVRVQTSAGCLLVTGKKLRLRRITDEYITVTGDIDGIQYI